MNRKDLIKKYIEFFKSHGHAQIKNSSLVPENDPTVLFTTAGMHPLVPYLLGETHPQGKRVCNVQRCIRTGDIEEVGDTTHHTFFEMLGNWSLGDYFKSKAIEMSYEFLTKVLELPKERLAVTVFEGDKNAPRDEEAAQIWKDQGVPEEKIAYLPKEENWWGPAGETGPCGPDTEMFYWKPNNTPASKTYDPEDENWVEIWNDVLMQYDKDINGNYNEATQQSVDTGMGVERTIAILAGLEDNYLASMWKPIIEKIETLSKHKYGENEAITKSMRIAADHVKAATFIIADGITPGNAEQGYVLRRLIRRAVRHGRILGIQNFTTKVADSIYELYDDYSLDKEKINQELEKEELKFLKTLEKGLQLIEKGFDKCGWGDNPEEERFSFPKAFFLYQSYGFPIEITLEVLKEKGVSENNLNRINEEFNKALNSHQALSRTASAGKFKSGLADNSEQTTKLHTACHMLNQALREVLKDKNINQRGSNITPDRLRFDFNFDRKLTTEEKTSIEDLMNKKIQESLPVTMQEMTLAEAKEQGVVGVFDDKYGEKVKVYKIGNFSSELCAGPHVENTSKLGTFKIKKEQSSSSGVRRIKAVLE